MSHAEHARKLYRTTGNIRNTNHENQTMKTAIILISDPKRGTDEALGRVLNGLVYARESNESGDQVAIAFSGPGTRWPAELTKLDHPANELYNFVRPQVVGASCGCAVVFGATDGLEAAGVPLLKQYELPGVPPVASYRQLVANGWNVSVF
jgi:hypothetical protein